MMKPEKLKELVNKRARELEDENPKWANPKTWWRLRALIEIIAPYIDAK